MATSVRQQTQRRIPFWGLVVVAVLTIAALAAGVIVVLNDPPPRVQPRADVPVGQAAQGAVTNLDAAPASEAFVPRALGSTVGTMRVTGWVQGTAAIDPGTATSRTPVTVGTFGADLAGSQRIDVATQLTSSGCTDNSTLATTRMQLVDGADVVASAQVAMPPGARTGALATTSLNVPAAQATRPLTVRVLLDNCTTGASGDGFSVRVAATRLAS